MFQKLHDFFSKKINNPPPVPQGIDDRLCKVDLTIAESDALDRMGAEYFSIPELSRIFSYAVSRGSGVIGNICENNTTSIQFSLYRQDGDDNTYERMPMVTFTDSPLVDIVFMPAHTALLSPTENGYTMVPQVKTAPRDADGNILHDNPAIVPDAGTRYILRAVAAYEHK